MLALKLTVVPLFIAAVTLAGWRWGTRVSGLLGGLPVVAGPIVVFIAIEHGTQFGSLAATAAISAIAGIMAFGIAYSWASARWPWPAALASGLATWLIAAIGLATLPPSPLVALATACIALAIAPFLLPCNSAPSAQGGSLRDLPYRMFTGGLLAAGVTGMAAAFGEVWSGFLASFPIISLVLALFTHRTHGPHQVAHMYLGMVLGLYSFASFFLVLALLWPHVEFWTTCATALVVSVAVQVVVQQLAKPMRPPGLDLGGT